VLHLLHLEDVGALRALKVFPHLCLVVQLELLQPASQLLLQLVRQRGKVLIVQHRSIVHLHDDALNQKNSTSASIVWSTIAGVIPTIIGTGAARYSFKGAGRIGMRTCSHLKGKTKARKAYIAKPSMVLDCETKMIFF